MRANRAWIAAGRRAYSTHHTSHTTQNGLMGGIGVASAAGAVFWWWRDQPAHKDADVTAHYLSSGNASLTRGAMRVSTVGERVTRDELRRRFAFRGNEGRQINVIGRGAYGRVIGATDNSTGREVAIKVVPKHAMSAEAVLHEVDVLRRVRGHDHIIHLHDVLECPDTDGTDSYHLVTELCDGGEVLDRLFKAGPFDESVASRVADRVASALQHVHRCGYVHLDIKPENIVFAGNDGTLADGRDCRLVDFGMATELRESAGKLAMTQGSQNGRVGTMAYWAPEQIACVVSGAVGDAHKPRRVVTSDPRAVDLWALGVVLYIMMLGAHPFDPPGKASQRQIARAVLRGAYNFDIHGNMLQISPDAQDLISRLLDPNPETRLTAEGVQNHSWVAQHRGERIAYDGARLEQASREARLRKRALSSKAASALSSPTSSHHGHASARGEGDAAAEGGIADAGDANGVSVFAQPNVRGALVAAVLVAANAFVGGESTRKDGRVDLLKEAFRVLDMDGHGKVSVSDIDRMLRAIGDGGSHPDLVGCGDGTDEARFEEHIAFEQFLSLLGDSCLRLSFPPGEVVFEQGTEPKGCFIIMDGTCRVEYTSADGGCERVGLATLGPGSLFGETSLLKGQKTRSSTIRCVTPAEVLFIQKDSFLSVLSGSPALAERLIETAEQQQARRLHQLIAHLAPLGSRVERFPRGHLIFRQGDSASSIHLIRKGVVETTVSAAASCAEGFAEIGVRVGQRVAGDLVGTSALAGTKGTTSRHCTVTCLSPVEVLTVDAAELEKLIRTEPMLQFYVESQLRSRKEATQQSIQDLERGVSEPQLFPAIGHDSELRGCEREGNDGLAESAPVAMRRGAAVLPAPMDEELHSELDSEGGVQVRRVDDGSRGVGSGGDDDVQAYREYARVVSMMKRKTFSPGDPVFEKGQPPKYFYIVDSGFATVEYSLPSGEVLNVAQLGPGDHFGEQALLQEHPSYTSTVRCVTPVEVLQMTRTQFRSLVGDGQTPFARAAKKVMRQRQHRWVSNLLSLAYADQKARAATPAEGSSRMHPGSGHADHERGAGSKRQLLEAPAKASQGVSRIIFRSGDTVFKESDPAEAIWFIHRGEIELSVWDAASGTRRVTERLGPGDTIGLESLREGAVHGTTATGISSGAVLSKITKDTLLNLIREHNYVSVELERRARHVSAKHDLQSKDSELRRRLSHASLKPIDATKTEKR